MPRIRALFPEAKILIAYRDGRDVALGLRNLPFTSQDLYVNFALWLHCCRLQRNAVRRHGPAIQMVRHEDLVAEPERVLRRVVEFLDLPYEHSIADGAGPAIGIPDWERAWKGKAAEPISAAGVGSWRRRLSADEIAVMESWGRRELQELGYDLATDGQRRLSPLFRIRVACKSLRWLLARPPFADHKRIWESRLAAMATPSRGRVFESPDQGAST